MPHRPIRDTIQDHIPGPIPMTGPRQDPIRAPNPMTTMDPTMSSSQTTTTGPSTSRPSMAMMATMDHTTTDPIPRNSILSLQDIC